MRGFRPMYVFSVLAVLFLATIWMMIKEATGADTMAVMTAAMGGLLAMMGTVVQHEFREAKRDTPTRASDIAAPKGVTGGPEAGAAP